MYPWVKGDICKECYVNLTEAADEWEDMDEEHHPEGYAWLQRDSTWEICSIDSIEFITNNTIFMLYFGEINESDEPHGRGIQINSDSEYYKGEWKDGNCLLYTSPSPRD